MVFYISTLKYYNNVYFLKKILTICIIFLSIDLFIIYDQLIRAAQLELKFSGRLISKGMKLSATLLVISFAGYIKDYKLFCVLHSYCRCPKNSGMDFKWKGSGYIHTGMWTFFAASKAVKRVKAM